jgi:energy-coupling factor transport system ATP-binding protein
MKAIEVRNLSYWYPQAQKPTLYDINIEVAEGEFVAILGPSASGKTTLALSMIGVISHLFGGRLTGSVTVQEKDARALSLPEIARKVGVVFQDPETMFCNLRVKEEVAFGLENLCIDPSQMTEMVRGALEAVGLEGFEERYIHELSGGELQRLAIACALAADPPILVFDEPTSSIDPAGTEALYTLLQELRAKGKTIIITSKEWNPCVTEADTIIVLADGKVMCKGSPYEVANDMGCHLSEAGIFLPEVTEVALELRKRGFSVPSLPLTVREAANLFQNWKPNYTNYTTGDSTASAKRALALELSSVSFTYPNGIVAVRDVGMQVPAGSVCALVGNNGAGKTTLAKLIVGLLRPQCGTITVFGETVQPRSHRSVYPGIAYVFQNPAHQFLADSVYDEVALGLRVRGQSEASIRPKVNAVLERFGLSELRSSHPLTVSAAQQRLVALASALVLEPRILIADEPTHGQDRFTADNLRELFSELKTEGTTIILISHDMRFVEACADVVYVMSQGSIIFTGSPSQLVRKAEVMERAGLKPSQLAQLVQTLAETDWDGFAYPRTPAEFVSAIWGAGSSDRGAIAWRAIKGASEDADKS